MNRKMKPMQTATPFRFDCEFYYRAYSGVRGRKDRLGGLCHRLLYFLRSDSYRMHGVCAVVEGQNA